MYVDHEELRRPRNAVFEGSSRACSSFHDAEYGSANSRDSLAETFVSSFLNLKHEVAGSVEKGLSKFFELDAFLRGCQAKVDRILECLSQNPDENARQTLILELNNQLEQMCQAQTRTNQKWQLIDEQLSQAVGETDMHCKRAEVFFRSKQKRGESRTLIPMGSRGKIARRMPTFGESSKSLHPAGRGIRPSLLPKRMGDRASGIVRKPKMDSSYSKFEESNQRGRSDTPEKSAADKRPKLVPAAKKWAKRMENLKHRELKERKKAQVSPIKKRRQAAAQRQQKRSVKDDSDDFSASDESKDSSDPPYSSSDTSRNARIGSEDGEKTSGSRKKNAQDEPKYCTCRMISFGNMVGCDNTECVIEWFHFACVGLKAKPRGKWYCPTCRDGDNCKLLKVRPPNENSQVQVTAGS